jgi:trehalose 6-phosphate synthase
VVKESERINARFRAKNWQPIHLLMKHHTHIEIEQFYRNADVCLVTSLHDGMNLVAKEYIASRHDEKGVLILSQFTGASRELRDAFIVNPYDLGQTAEAVRAALEMPVAEQRDRMKRMRMTLNDKNIYWWASELIRELVQVRLGKEG